VGGLDRKFTETGCRTPDALPAATLAVVPDAVHTVHLERPETWLEAVVPFVSERGSQV
jgi:2-succinyl-5-enolpyruvyl-6-hydroxy-3-cyclohexene-1-carboxylate synthase/2-succinyl-6-hydroxy-2,4-cyclohexadiene-1-carboxylate synthase